MPRRRVAAKRRILPDPIYNDVIVAKLINDMMEGGKKSLSEGIIYGAFEMIDARAKDFPAQWDPKLGIHVT